MPLTTYTAGEVLTASSLNANFSFAALSGGLVPIVPTSVAVGSGTGTANANGQVTFTTASSVSLNGVFSATYKNYLVIFNEDTASTTSAIQFRMRLAGTDNSTASSYRTQYIRATTTTVSAARELKRLNMLK